MKNEPIRILHVIGVMHRGGAETMIMNYYRNIDRTRVQFDFVENAGMKADYDEEIRAMGGRIYRCPRYRGKNHIAYVAWWKQFLAEHGCEYSAVHGHIGSTASIYLYLAKKAGIYTIAHSHNTASLDMKSILYQMYAYPTRHIADFFFGCSKDAGISRYGRNVCADSVRFTVLNNAIETRKFGFDSHVRAEMRRQLGVEDKLVIGHVGRFEDQKNHEFLIRIFSQICNLQPDAVLLLIGDGNLRSRIETQINRKGLSNSVILAGVQSDVSAWYQAMDVFVLPSLYEGLGIVAVEAQASGLPCVVSDTVSKECMVTSDLVSVVSLKEDTQAWARRILSSLTQKRFSRKDEVAQSGYDIQENAVWLENFYLSRNKDDKNE